MQLGEPTQPQEYRRLLASGLAVAVCFATSTAVAQDDRPAEAAPSVAARGDEQPQPAPEVIEGEDPAPLVSARYENHALRFESNDGNYAAQIQHRLQFRYAWPFDPDPRSLAHLDQERGSFMVRRARFKLRGHAFRPWLQWYLQYDWAQPVLRDFSVEINHFPWLRVLVGRRKVLWNAERVTSSGKQQFVNRSIINDLFTVDRQQGIQLYGRLFPNTFADITYYAGVFSGEGVGEQLTDVRHMMYAARLQWNLLGGELEFSQSDIDYHETPVVNLAIGAATNVSECTTYATDPRSCRALPTPRSDGSDFGDPSAPGEVVDDQFRIDQLFAELRGMWRGLSVTHELHVKRVRDRTLSRGAPRHETTLRGSLTQLGYFPHGLISAIPEPLEVAVRFAHVDPAVGSGSDWQTEASAVINCFFSGHANKLSAEASWLTVDQPGATRRGQTRVRLQWDVSF